jgi:hypothetical protein
MKSPGDALVNVRRVAYEQWRISGEKRWSCERKERTEVLLILVVIFLALATSPVCSYARDRVDHSIGRWEWIVSLLIVNCLPGLWS